MSNKVRGSRSGTGLRPRGAVLWLDGGRGTYGRRVTGSWAHARTHTYMRTHTHIHAHTHPHTLAIPLASTQPQLGRPAAAPPFMQPFWTQTPATPHPILDTSSGARAREQGLRGQGTGRLSPAQSNPTPPLRRLPSVSFYMTVSRGRASGYYQSPDHDL